MVNPVNAGQKKHFPATARNREPILAVLKKVLPPKGRVLEVASGSGEHAAYFASRFSGLTWQPSDVDPENLASIGARVKESCAPNLRQPIALDARADPWPVEKADIVYCANMIHIAPWAVALGLLAGAGRALPPGGILFLYGPFVVQGRPTAPSNEAFDEDLRRRDPEWGLRALADVVAEAETHGLALAETVAMPANNLSVVLRKN